MRDFSQFIGGGGHGPSGPMINTPMHAHSLLAAALVLLLRTAWNQLLLPDDQRHNPTIVDPASSFDST